MDNSGQMILNKSKVRILDWYENSFILPSNFNQVVVLRRILKYQWV